MHIYMCVWLADVVIGSVCHSDEDGNRQVGQLLLYLQHWFSGLISHMLNFLYHHTQTGTVFNTNQTGKLSIP